MIPLIKSNKIPKNCPICGGDLHYIDATETEAEVYIVFCRNTKTCKYCQEWDKKDLKRCH